jgi:hypothetical protein
MGNHFSRSRHFWIADLEMDQHLTITPFAPMRWLNVDTLLRRGIYPPRSAFSA